MNVEFLKAMDILEKEKGISKETLIAALQFALLKAYEKNYGQSGSANPNVEIYVNGETGEIQIFASKTVVEKVSNPTTEVDLETAQEMHALYEIGDVVRQEVFPQDFGRIAVSTAKQVIVQKIKEAERGAIMGEYSDKEHEALTAIVRYPEKNGVCVSLGKADGFIPTSERMNGEVYTPNMHIKVYVLEVNQDSTSQQIIVSRTHPELVRRLFEMEVPEIQSGTVEIKAISREAGSRTKIAVHSSNPNVDPIYACVGERGRRVESIVHELNNEKIDIIEWDADPAVYIAKALSPAKVIMVYTNDQNNSAKVVVPNDQLSLAIGNRGQNARLAARLTRWDIDIKSESQFADEVRSMLPEDAESFGINAHDFVTERNVFDELNEVFDDADGSGNK